MMRGLKLKYLLILLLGFSLMAPYFVNHICYQHFKTTHKKAVKKRFTASLKLEELEKHRFNPVQFKALEWDGDNEFYIGTKKYDLYRVDHDGENLIVWAWWDHKEAELEKRFHQMLHYEKNQPLKDKENLSLDKLPKYLAKNTQGLDITAYADSVSREYTRKLFLTFIAIDSPPPRSV
jgi:hypothetical protein